MINVVIFDNYKIVCDGIESLISDISDIKIVAKVTGGIRSLIETLSGTLCHVALFNVYSPDGEALEHIRTIRRQFPKINILMLSMSDLESFVLKTIKAGAKGYLSKDTTRSELLEAIYTLRNGFDYYGKSITNILLRGYLNQTSDKDEEQPELSGREIEVLRLLGNGMTNQEIADKLFVSIRTVESHKSNIMRKINLRTTVDLIKFAIRNNYMDV
jgi:two-component system response regulator NreC